MRRFRRTLDAMLCLCFGTEREARAVAARINAIHDYVQGRLPEAAGLFPTGARYSAHDPALLAWVHATLLDMNLRVYELYVDPLPLEEKDRYCAESSAIEPLLGIPEGRLPRSFGDLRRDMQAALAGGEIAVTEVARDLAQDIVSPPVPRVARLPLWLMRGTSIGLLPPPIREGYGFAWSAREEAALRVAAGLVRRLLRLTPSIIRHWPAARSVLRAAS